MGDETRIFMGTPTKEEIMRYFAQQQSKQRIKRLEEDIYDRDSSPELSDSFKIELEQRKKKVEAEKMRLARELDPKNDKENKGPPPTTTSFQEKLSLRKPNETIDEESFLEMEKMCERTLNLNNVTEPFVDLTTMDDYEADESSFLNDLKKKKSLGIGDETHINEIEAPSFVFNNTSSLLSPNKNSPLKLVRGNRPSTIMEITETSISNRTAASSYVTAKSSGSAEKSEYYQTANESLEEVTPLSTIKRPTLKPFFDDDGSFNFTKDSLNVTEKGLMGRDEMTLDSLNSRSKADSTSGVDSSCYDPDLDAAEADESVNFDDTLDRMNFMLDQATKMNENQPKTPVGRPIDKLATPKSGTTTPLASSKQSPSPWSATKLKQQQLTKLKSTPVSAAAKRSPLIKFSPVAAKSPATAASFKLPAKPASSSKIPQFSGSSSKKFQHIVSPISRYINHTPELPLGSNAHIQYGAGSSRHFNFRDSESFCNMSLNTSVQASSLPMRAKTKSSTSKQVIDNRLTPKIPGGKKVQGLLGNSSPSVTIHKGHMKTGGKHDIFKDNTFDDTALSEQSFADLSLMTGDVSIQVVEGVKRLK